MPKPIEVLSLDLNNGVYVNVLPEFFFTLKMMKMTRKKMKRRK